MKLVAVLLLACCLTGCYSTDVEFKTLRHLLKRAKSSTTTSATSDTPGGRAATSATASTTGGTAEAVATATSEAFTSVENNLVEYFEYAFNNLEGSTGEDKEEYCENALSILDEQLEAVGSVTARAYTEALAQVDIQGKGEACASSDATAESQASGFAKIVAEAIADASNKVSQAEAEVQVESVIHVLAGAFSTAFSAACLRGEGSAFAVQTSLAEAISRPLAVVTVSVVSEVDCTGAKGFSEAEASSAGSAEESVLTETEGTSDVEGEGEAETGGTAEAFTAIIERCSGVYVLCCRVDEDECKCSRTRTARCHAVRDTYDKGEYWRDDDAEVYCTCSRRHTHARIYPIA